MVDGQNHLAFPSQTPMATLSPIPQPPVIPFLGNAALIDKEVPLKSFALLAQQYGEIYQFAYPDGRVVLHLNTHPLVSQASDDKKFKKLLSRPLEEVRNFLGGWSVHWQRRRNELGSRP